jgi:hypothetical protein
MLPRGLMRDARQERRRLSGGAVVLVLLVISSMAGHAASTPTRGPAENCVSERVLRRSDARSYHRFNVLPRLYDHWRSLDCFPRRVDDAELATAEFPAGLMVAVNGRDAVIVDVDAAWLDACTRGSVTSARLDRTSGADLLELRDQIARIPGLKDVDVLELGLGRAITSNGTRLQAILVGTLERSVRLQCYDDLEPMIEQAARIFRDDRESVDGLYDFLSVEKSTESLALGNRGQTPLSP